MNKSHNEAAIADTISIPINNAAIFLLNVFENIFIISLDTSIKINITGNKKFLFTILVLKNSKYSFFILNENISGDNNKSNKNIIDAVIIIIDLYIFAFSLGGFGRLSKSIKLEILIFLFEINKNINVTKENANNIEVQILLDILIKFKHSLFINILIIDETITPKNVEDNTIFNISFILLSIYCNQYHIYEQVHKDFQFLLIYF